MPCGIFHNTLEPSINGRNWLGLSTEHRKTKEQLQIKIKCVLSLDWTFGMVGVFYSHMRFNFSSAITRRFNDNEQWDRNQWRLIFSQGKTVLRTFMRCLLNSIDARFLTNHKFLYFQHISTSATSNEFDDNTISNLFKFISLTVITHSFRTRKPKRTKNQKK